MDLFKGMIQRPICWSDRMVTERAGGKMGEVWRRIYLGGNPDPLPSPSPISPEEDSPSPSIPCLPSLNWVWPEIEDYPWLLNFRNDTTVEIQFPFIWEILQPFLGNFRFQEDTDFINERPKQETKGVENHSYWQQGRKGLNDWDRWRKVLIWFHKLPLRQLDYNSSTAVAAIFQKMEITNLSSAAFS